MNPFRPAPRRSGAGPDEVRAAGGVVLRTGPSGPEVLVVHRPRYGDWSLPKGKCDEGEDDLDAARREVAEETGIVADAGRELASIRYDDRFGQPKRVRYWIMTVRDDAGFSPNDEVDEVRWIPVAEAATLLTYAHDRGLVRGLGDVGEADA